MSYKKDLEYRDKPFSLETPQEDFFLYDAISNLYTKCENSKDKIIKVRTVGIFESKNGRFYIKQIPSSCKQTRAFDPKQCIQVSVAHMHITVRCPTMPYLVQLFGRLQWCTYPVIFAQIIQPLSVSIATMLNETMIRVSNLHSSRQECPEVDHESTT